MLAHWSRSANASSESTPASLRPIWQPSGSTRGSRSSWLASSPGSFKSRESPGQGHGGTCAARIAEKRLSLAQFPALRTEAAQSYSGLAWYQLRASQFAAAEQSIRRGLELDADNLYLRARLPLAILLQGGRFEEARSLYLKWADKPFGLDELDTFKAVFRQDLQAVLDWELVGMERVGEMMVFLGE